MRTNESRIVIVISLAKNKRKIFKSSVEAAQDYGLGTTVIRQRCENNRVVDDELWAYANRSITGNLNKFDEPKVAEVKPAAKKEAPKKEEPKQESEKKVESEAEKPQATKPSAKKPAQKPQPAAKKSTAKNGKGKGGASKK